MNTKTKELIYQISAVTILFAAVFYLFQPDISRFVMIAGVVGFIYSTFTNRYQGNSLRGKRLFNMQVFAVVIMAAAAYLMYVYIKEWVVLMLISGILILYSSIMLSYIDKKEKENNKDNWK